MKSLTNIAYDKILQKIIYLEYEPGKLLNEKIVANDLKMSIAPVREAFHRLAEEKLVTIYPRRGIIVAPIELNKIIEMFEIRLALESYIGSVITQRINENQIKNLEETLIKMREISNDNPSTDDYRNFLEHEKIFHFIIYGATSNKEFVEIQKKYFNFAYRLLWLYKDDSILMDSICNEFKEMIEALKEKDSTRSKEMLESHVRNSFEFIKKRF
jgi:DNA-binding GntR family transcriptional regulator